MINAIIRKFAKMTSGKSVTQLSSGVIVTEWFRPLTTEEHIEQMIDWMESHRKYAQDPCKNYATRENAEKAVAKAAEKFGADYIVFYNDAWGRWIGAINTGDFSKKNGFYTY